MTKVEDYDDVSVQIFERLRVYQVFMDLMFETVAVKEFVESKSKVASGYRNLLCLHGIRQMAIVDSMKKIMRTAELLMEHMCPEGEEFAGEEFAGFERHVRLVEKLVMSVTNQLIEATGIRGETDRYERAVIQWQSDVSGKRADMVKVQIRRLEEQKS